MEYQSAEKRIAQFAELDDCIPDRKQNVEANWEAKELGEMLNEFLGTIDPKSCAIFHGRYFILIP